MVDRSTYASLAPALPSLASWLASDPDRQSEFVASLSDEEALALEYEWRGFWARPGQLPPLTTVEGKPWTTWLVMAGRGFGKTRTGAEWVRERVEQNHAGRIALVGATTSDVREVMIEGPGGLLAISPPWSRPRYEPSKRRITWPNGAIATTYTAEEPDILRGPQHDTAWCDELAKWSYPRETWDNLQLGLRLGSQPQQVVTTTPRPLAVLKEILARSDTVVTTGSTYENRENLAPAFFAEVIKRYEGTRLGRQELQAELLEDIPGALWTRAMLDGCRLKAGESQPQLARVVVGVDPSGTRGGDNRDSVGIVAVGKGIDGRAYVIGDYTCSLSPDGWGRRVIECADCFKADCIAVETNFGGAMAESTVQTHRPSARVKAVDASRGKHVRAEPISALYEQGRVRHAGAFTELEDQLVCFTASGYVGDHSPDRADAMVWALTELMLEPQAEEGWLSYARESLAARAVANSVRR